MRCQGSQVSVRVASGSASWLSSQWERTRASRRVVSGQLLNWALEEGIKAQGREVCWQKGGGEGCGGHKVLAGHRKPGWGKQMLSSSQEGRRRRTGS